MQRKYAYRRVAITAILTALSIVILTAAGIVPMGRLGLVACAGMMPAAATVSVGLGAGGLCYAGTSLLSLLLLPDKAAALMYLFFFGGYPVVKSVIERLGKLPLEIFIKLILFNAALTLFRFGLESVFFSILPVGDLALWILYPAGSAVFMAYDFGFSGLISAYTDRVDRYIRKIKHS